MQIIVFSLYYYQALGWLIVTCQTIVPVCLWTPTIYELGQHSGGWRISCWCSLRDQHVNCIWNYLKWDAQTTIGIRHQERISVVCGSCYSSVCWVPQQYHYHAVIASVHVGWQIGSLECNVLVNGEPFKWVSLPNLIMDIRGGGGFPPPPQII